MQIPPPLDEGFKLREGVQFCAPTVKAKMMMQVCKGILVAESRAMQGKNVESGEMRQSQH